MQIINLILTALIFGLGIGIAFSIYLLPWIIAYNANSKKKDIILALNILLGFTIVGWGFCLFWALQEKKIKRELEDSCNQLSASLQADT